RHLPRGPPVMLRRKGADEGMDTSNGQTRATGPALTPGMTLSEKADAVEEHLLEELNLHVAKSVLFTSGDQDPTQPTNRTVAPGRLALMGDDPRLQKMPDKPTLLDFFKYRF